MKKITVLVVLSLLLSPLIASAAGMRCDGYVISEGATKVEVLQKCGEPLMKDVVGEETVFDYFLGSGSARKVVVEQWVYDMGAGSFMRILTFKGGKLATIEHGDRQ